MFPLSDSINSGKIAYLNYFVVIVTIYIFIQQFLSPDPEAFINSYALIPSKVTFGDLHSFLPFITAIFLHGGFLHILTNMWFLIIFGDNVSAKLTPIGFLLLYLISGVAGNLAQYFIDPTSTLPILGASGAIAGILGCYFVLFPYSKIKTLIFVVFFVTIVELSAPIVLGYWFILQLFSGFGSLSASSYDQGGVAFFAHIAGFIIGVIAGNIIKRRSSPDYIVE
jgi:membrane associated rhomboid family serine protease